MRVRTRQAYHRCILRVIEHALQESDGLLRVSEAAAGVGYSRYHLNRLFSEQMGESLRAFTRRMRLERAAYLLQTSPITITEAACEVGYANPEVFSRAFHAAFGLPPSSHRDSSRSWQLPAASGVHWNATLSDARFAPCAAENVAVRIVTRAGLRMAAMPYVGDYKDIPSAWERLQELLPNPVWEQSGARLLTLYHDDGKTAANPNARRADIGFTVAAGTPPPKGMRILEIPGGQYAQTNLLFGPERHADAWDYLNRIYIPKTKQRPKNIPGLDEYKSLPVPWNQLRARILIGLELDMGIL